MSTGAWVSLPVLPSATGASGASAVLILNVVNVCRYDKEGLGEESAEQKLDRAVAAEEGEVRVPNVASRRAAVVVAPPLIAVDFGATNALESCDQDPAAAKVTSTISRNDEGTMIIGTETSSTNTLVLVDDNLCSRSLPPLRAAECVSSKSVRLRLDVSLIMNPIRTK